MKPERFLASISSNPETARRVIRKTSRLAAYYKSVIQVKNSSVFKSIVEGAEKRNITTICIGKSHFTLIDVIIRTNVFNQLLTKLSASDTDLIILS